MRHRIDCPGLGDQWESILFRVPNEQDLWKAYERLPILATDDGGAVVSFPTPERRADWNIEIANRLLSGCAISPRLVLDNPVDIPEGCFPLSEIKVKNRQRMFLELLQLAGFTKEAGDALAPLSGTGTDSESSTPSASDTADALPSASGT